MAALRAPLGAGPTQGPISLVIVTNELVIPHKGSGRLSQPRPNERGSIGSTGTDDKHPRVQGRRRHFQMIQAQVSSEDSNMASAGRADASVHVSYVGRLSVNHCQAGQRLARRDSAAARVSSFLQNVKRTWEAPSRGSS